MITNKNYSVFAREARRIAFRERYASHQYEHKWQIGDKVRQNRLYHYLVGKQTFRWAIIIDFIDKYYCRVKTNKNEIEEVAKIWIDKI